MSTQNDRPVADERKRDTVRRLQVGITGLALVALLVGLSTLLTREARQSAGAATDTTQADAAATGANASASEGALTDLGVEPAASDPAVAPPATPTVETPPPVGPRVPDLQPDPQLEGIPRR